MNLDETIIEGLKTLPDEVNPYVRNFLSVKDRFGKESTHGMNLDETIIVELNTLLDEVNPCAQKFQPVKDRFGGELPQDISMRIFF